MATTLATVQFSSLSVLDATRDEIVREIARPVTGSRPKLCFALHVGALVQRHDQSFRAALAQADVLYADGVAIVLLARAAGARRVERAPTTDIGIPVIDRMRHVLGRKPRLALIGGAPGVAERAGEVLQRRVRTDVVLRAHGYHQSWDEVRAALTAQAPDMVIVGMGMPREAEWCVQHAPTLPPASYLTCGGWFGFLTGQERRAPEWARQRGIEWAFRAASRPELLRRYVPGAAATVRVLASTLVTRGSLRGDSR